MDIVLNSRHCELSDKYRAHVEEKLARLEKHDHRVIRVEVEVEKERNPRQADRAVRVELTAFSKGPVVRAEAAAEDKMAALDLAIDRMAAQMRRAADRRRVHRGRHTPQSVARALADVEQDAPLVSDAVTTAGPAQVPADGSVNGSADGDLSDGPIAVLGEGPLVVRTKSHPAAPMTLDQALYEMELVGHDFFLFVDKESERPSVVYRRRGYDYGVISLDVS
jgi:ribosomal subunit interface protein